MTDPVAADIKKVLDPVTAGPVTESFALFSSFGIFGRCHMIDDGFDPGSIKDPVLVLSHKVIDGNWSCYFMTEYTVKAQNRYAFAGRLEAVSIEYFFSNGTTHISSAG